MKNNPAPAEEQPFVTVAKIVKPQGRHGEVAVELLTDFPQQFAQRRSLSAVSRLGERRQLQLEDFWEHKGRLVMKFTDVDSIDAAEQLAGWELQIPMAERAELEPGSVYAADLIGCRLFVISADGGENEIGRIDDVVFGAGEAPLLIVAAAGNRELMIPFAQAYIRQLNTAARRLLMNLPDGMLDLDAPLSPAEKEAQQRKQ